MDKIIIEGGRQLKGKVRISGSKNSSLPLMAASLLTSEKIDLKNVPQLADIRTMARLLKHMGVEVFHWGERLKLTARKLSTPEAPYELVRTMRASILVLGPLLARFGKARVSLPGGCAIGARPVNLHIKAFEAMGAQISIEGGYIEAHGQLKGAPVFFDQVSVTGTENVMMGAVLAEGETIIENAAREPEIDDLADLLTKMGAKISGAGTDVIRIQGVKSLRGAQHEVIADRIEAGTYMIAAAMTSGNVVVEKMQPKHVDSLTQKLREAGVEVRNETDTSLRVIGPQKIKATDVSTAPYPGFATDFQAQFMSMLAVAQGSSVVTETIFENRFMHVLELMRMGAQLKVEGNSVFVTGAESLQGAPVMATDLRASACLVLAALAAKGVTEIHRVYHLDRGYDRLEKKFRKLGARVRRAKVKY